MWETIKNLLQKGSGKCIIVEDEKPAYVVMKIEDYENLLEGEPSETKDTEMEKVNRDIAAWKASEKEAHLEEVVPEKEAKAEEVKVEDLPF
jgi:hypothetical protein